MTKPLNNKHIIIMSVIILQHTVLDQKILQNQVPNQYVAICFEHTTIIVKEIMTDYVNSLMPDTVDCIVYNAIKQTAT